MLMILRNVPLALVLAVGSCGAPADPEEGDAGANEALIAQCEQICLKPLCDGALDPTEDVQAVCRASCEEEVDEVSREACSETYDALHQCLEALTCDEFYQWLEQQADMPCDAEEQLLSAACPDIDIRSAGN